MPEPLADDNIVPINSKPAPSIIFVTPEMAERWLKQNTKNRPLTPSDVNRYARDMLSGAWEFTGEAIKFGNNGALLDGQHRLAAIIKSGVTLPLLVIRELDPAVQRVMDTGRRRTAADALSLNGEKNATLLAATARLALGVASSLDDPGKYNATNSEIELLLEERPDLRSACEFARPLARRTDCPPAVVAYTFWRLSQIDMFEAAQFWVAASEKVGLKPGDPVLALTNRAAEARRNREVLTKRIYLSMIYRAWNYRRAGKPLRIMKVQSAAGGLIPVPEPK
ncbi:MAG: hypothetical protein EPO65_00535 [Dehalococcoidia bacterium]|nr:MAG: hypothetical protein EPO65_00535 [Dehalococcoidia bacterium]